MLTWIRDKAKAWLGIYELMDQLNEACYRLELFEEGDAENKQLARLLEENESLASDLADEVLRKQEVLEELGRRSRLISRASGHAARGDHEKAGAELLSWVQEQLR